MKLLRARVAGLVGAVLLGATMLLSPGGCGPKKPPKLQGQRMEKVQVPAFPREFRAAWVTTWENIDWPSSGSLSTYEQQRDIDATIERARDLKLNALILQVRGAANAIFPSNHEPWAGSLTGKRGRAPNPSYDPLQMWIDKCHAAGIELHAWIVPFTAWDDPPGTYHGTHKPKTLKHGKYVYFDPGDDETRKYVTEVAGDIVRTYAMDGITFDHHTYPDPTTQPTTVPATLSGPAYDPSAQRGEFPDDDSFKTQSRGIMSRADWRRDNIDRFVHDLYKEIHGAKPWVRLGISPFGIPSPDTPDFVKGAPYLDQYRVTFANPRQWLKNGWCDYLMPELYWKTGSPNQSFPLLLDWWANPEQNPKGRNIYSGLFTSAVNQYSTSWSPDEITGQIMITRGTNGAGGHGHYSMHTLNQNSKGIANLLQQTYGEGALPPTNVWLGKTPPAAPTGLKPPERIDPTGMQAVQMKRVIKPQSAGASRAGPTTRPFVALAPPSTRKAAKEASLGGFKLTWDAPKSSGPPKSSDVWRWAVYSKHGSTWHFQLVGRGESTAADQPIVAIVPDDANNGRASVIAISAIDQLGNESSKVVKEVTKAK